MSNSKTIVITGASSGIGEATARELVSQGHKVALIARRQDKLADIVSQLGSDNAISISADVSQFEQLSAAIEKIISDFGSIDVVFANAGKGVASAGTENGEVEQWDSMIDVNIKGLIYTAKATLPHLRKTQGHFITTSSAAGRTSIKGSIYGATKYFAYGFAMNLAQEMREWGGRSTVICPGVVNTAFFDQPKPDKLDPMDVADAVAFAVDAPQRNTVREIFLMPTH